MRLLLVAPPGAGKGTQAGRLASHYNVAHLSSGDLFRREVEEGTDLGREARAYLDRGDLVPDNLVMKMLIKPILEAAAHGGYVLDGFPRTKAQAEEAYEVARRSGGGHRSGGPAVPGEVELQAVVHLEVSRDELVRRLLARGREAGRGDDNLGVIEHRLAVYQEQTEPLLGYYSQRGLVIDVNGEQPVDDVFEDIVAAVDELRAGRA